MTFPLNVLMVRYMSFHQGRNLVSSRRQDIKKPCNYSVSVATRLNFGSLFHFVIPRPAQNHFRCKLTDQLGCNASCTIHSHSLRLNAFCINCVHRYANGCSDSPWYSYSTACMDSGYQFVITVITRSTIAVEDFEIHDKIITYNLHDIKGKTNALI